MFSKFSLIFRLALFHINAQQTNILEFNYVLLGKLGEQLLVQIVMLASIVKMEFQMHVLLIFGQLLNPHPVQLVSQDGNVPIRLGQPNVLPGNICQEMLVLIVLQVSIALI